MFGECHAHVIMDGVNYRKAVDLHKDGVKDEVIHRCFEQYRKEQVTFVRDGGDALGVSKRARELAPEYDIDYRTPVFAIHKEGHYGGIVGLAFRNMKEYHQLVLRAKAEGADFIKIMTTGILDFSDHGKITGEPLLREEVCEMVHIAHEEGMAVMSHTNGKRAVMDALEAGVDSLEHGNFMDEEALHQLASSDTVWVPTHVTIRNLLGAGRYDNKVIQELIEQGAAAIRLAYQYKAHAAPGSDAGAFQVYHGQGIKDEVQAFYKILGQTKEVTDWLTAGDQKIRTKFRRT